MQQKNIGHPAVLPSIEEERLHRKQRLAAAFRLWAKLGYDEGPAGHITARDPELSDHFWVNPFGKHFSLISVSDLLLVNHHGEVVEGNDIVNRAAFAIHSQIHAARPDVNAAAHCHSMHGKAWSSLGRLLDPGFVEDFALAAHLSRKPWHDFVADCSDIEEGLARRDVKGKLPVLDRTIDLRDHARPAGALANRVQHTEADAVAAKTGLRHPVEAVVD
jgi:ribulose-5-phosphate 4-epimerase/fuculose-1-phosphate aldolase